MKSTNTNNNTILITNVDYEERTLYWVEHFSQNKRQK